MNKKLTPLLAAATVMSMIMLAGCTELPGKVNTAENSEYAASEDGKHTLKEAVHQEIDEVADLVNKSVETAAGKVTDKVVEVMSEEGISQELSASQKIGDASVLEMNNTVGTIAVSSTQGDTISVDASLLMHNSSSHKADIEDILENAVISLETEGNTLEVSTRSKDKPNQDLWHWAQKKYGYSEFKISYDIQIPESMNTFKITNDVGNIELTGLEGTYKIVSHVGSITLNSAQITGKSTVKSDTGSIDLDITAMDASSSLKAESDVGRINAMLESSLKYDLSANSDIGKITGAKKGKSQINGGGPLIDLSTDIGSITVE